MNSVKKDKINESDLPEYSKNIKNEAHYVPSSDQMPSSYEDDSTGYITDDKKDEGNHKKRQSKENSKSKVESYE